MIRGRGHAIPISRLLSASTLLLVGLVAGCGGRGRGNPFRDGGDPGVLSTIILRVESRSVNDAEIYIYPPGERTLLGRVGGNALEFFEFGWNTAQPLDVEIVYLAGGRHRLPPLVPTRAGRVDLIIAQTLRNSFLGYR